MRWLLPLIVSTLAALAAADARERPPAGRELDQSVTIDSRQDIPPHCISVAGWGARIVLDRDTLDAMAASKASLGAWKTEAERLQAIAADRARKLLAGTGTAKDVDGCAVARLDNEADYLVGDLLEGGHAAVIAEGARRPEPRIVVHYVGHRCGDLCGSGHIEFLRVHDSRPFFRTGWWIA